MRGVCSLENVAGATEVTSEIRFELKFEPK